MKSVFAVICCMLLVFNTMGQEIQKKLAEISLDDLFITNTFKQKTIVQISPMNDDLHYAVIENDTQIVKYSYATGKQVAVLASVEQFGNQNIKQIDNFVFDESETKILFYVDRENIYRRSFLANYYVWDIEKQQLIAISNLHKQQVATFSPDGTKVAYVANNNLFVKYLDTDVVEQITTDGKINEIINGIPDWVYEEEFEYNKAFCWSPDSKNIAWCRFNESAVKGFSFSVFQGKEPSLTANQLYPTSYQYKYPKAGESNSIVSVFNANLETKQQVKIDVGANPDQYIPRLKWSPNGKLVVYRLNRLQNHLQLLYANLTDGSTQVFYSEENSRYIDETTFDYLTFNTDGSEFVWLSEKCGWLHIYLYKSDGKLINKVTNGAWDVTDFLGYDEKTGTIFYQSAETYPTNRDVYSIKIDGSEKQKITKQSGKNQLYFSKGYNYYISQFSDAVTPTIYTLHQRDGKLLRTLEDNANLKDTFNNYAYCKKEFLTFCTADSVNLNAWMIKPNGFDASKKYPVLMVQYSGPNSQMVVDGFSVGWEQVLAAKGYIVFCCDGRGTGARGEEFRKLTYLQLGKYELRDQLNAAEFLKSLPYIAADRIGIWGWSFGGFMTLNCMTQGNGIFKAGIAVAPVTNWRYYDNIYTERFMRTPQENANGYDENSPITHVDDFKGNLLLIHGSADDNVHWQNSAEMAEALVQANKQFDYFVYTNRNHSISGGNTTYHLYTKMLNFILEKL